MRTQLRDDAPRPDALLNLDEVCHFFGGLDPSTIYRNIRRGVSPRRSALARILPDGSGENAKRRSLQ
jgi:predicted DNA-binding transcriptional regulator AlpA